MRKLVVNLSWTRRGDEGGIATTKVVPMRATESCKCNPSISYIISAEMPFFIASMSRVMLGLHLHDSVARIGTNFVVPVRKLFVNWRELCVNTSGVRAMSGREFWNVQSFGHDKFSQQSRAVCANLSWTYRELVRAMREDACQYLTVRAMPRLPRIRTEQLTSCSRNLRKVVVPKWELRKLWANYSCICRAISCHDRELFVNHTETTRETRLKIATNCHDKIRAYACHRVVQV